MIVANQEKALPRKGLLRDYTTLNLANIIFEALLRADLDPGLAQAQLLAELLPHESVGVVGLVKQTLQAVQLLQTEEYCTFVFV